MTTTAVRSFPEFPVYSLGLRFEGHERRVVIRRRDVAPLPGEGGFIADYVSFVYGSCEVRSDVGCTPPLEVQVWPACRRTLSTYRATPFSDELIPHTRVDRRGVPAALIPEGQGINRLELYSGRVTIVIFGTDVSQLDRAAAALRGENNANRAGEALPPPLAGAIEGQLKC